MSLLERKHRLIDNPVLNLIFLLLAMLILDGWPVPSNAELINSMFLVKRWNPNFIVNDWTLSLPPPEHYMFDLLFGLLTLVFSIEVLGWIGRIVCWSLIFVALFRIGKYFQIPLWMTTLSILLWLIYGQSIVAEEYMFGHFEAKSIAYVCLLFSLDGFLSKKDIRAPILLGLAFSFHPAVGLWGGLGIGLSLLLRYPPDKLFKVGCYTALFALPGVIPMVPSLFGTAGGLAEDWKFSALGKFANRLDPSSWPKRDLLLVYLLFLFNWLHVKKNGDNEAMRLLISFQGFLCLFFSLGLLFRLAENYELLKFMPFGAFAVFSLLLFFFHLMNAYHHHSSIKLGSGAIAIAFAALLSLDNPFAAVVDQARINYVKWTEGETDLQKTFKWFVKNTPEGSILIAPPWRDDSLYLSRRAQVVMWGHPTYDRLREWRERIQALVGNDWINAPEETWAEKMEPSYNKLTPEDIGSIVKRYGGEYLVSRAHYSYPVLFDSGTYKVYSLVPFAARER